MAQGYSRTCHESKEEEEEEVNSVWHRRGNICAHAEASIAETCQKSMSLQYELSSEPLGGRTRRKEATRWGARK